MSLVLREKQDKAVDMIRETFKNGHKKVMLYAPCAFGKTELSIHMMDAAKDKGNKSSMILDRIILCQQTSKRLDKYGIPHGINQSQNERYDPSQPIQVCSAQTLEKRGSLPAMDFMIIDEAHDKRRMMMEFVDNSDIYTLGLSASPFTKGLKDHYDAVVSPTTIKELVDDKELCPLKVYIAKEISMVGASKVAGEWSSSEVTDRGRKIIGDIVSEWVKKTHEHYGKPEKTIVFSAGVKHGDELAQQFQEAGYNFVNISYRNKDEEKKKVLEEFAKPDSEIQGVIATDILTKGFDCSDVKIGVSARPFRKSFSAHVQQLGRVTRTHEGKDYALWLDHSGNYLRFWSDWDDLYHNGVHELHDGKENPKKEPTERQKEAARCPQCHALWEGGLICSSCGYTKPNRSEIVSTPGELVALEENDKKKVDQDTKQDFYSQLLEYSLAHNFQKAEGWAAHKFKQKFGHWPDGLKKHRKPLTDEMKGWIKYTFIRQAKSKKK